jgi:hypothetical protein
MKIRIFMGNLPENIEVLENFPAFSEIFHAYTEIFLGWSANMVKFQVMGIFPENIKVLENLPAKTEIFHASMNIDLGGCLVW